MATNVTVPSSALLSLSGNSYQLIPAAGPSKAFIFDRVWIEYIPGSVPYIVAAGSQFAFFVGTTEVFPRINAIGFIDQSQQMIADACAKENLTALVASGQINYPLVITNTGQQFRNGNGSLKVIVYADAVATI